MTVPPTTEVDGGLRSASPLLVEFGKLWVRGHADADRVWSLFEASELYIERPEYFGAPMVPYRGALVSPVFSTRTRLAECCARPGARAGSPAESPSGLRTESPAGSPAPAGEWVLLRGADFLALPIRARYLVIDPGTRDEAVVDLTDRPGTTALLHGAPSALIDLEIGADGRIAVPAPFHALLSELSGAAS